MKTPRLQSEERREGNVRAASRRLPLAWLVLLAAVMAGCANFPVMVQDDPFKKTTVVSVDMWHTVLDSELDNVRTLYRKEITGNRISDPVATIVFVANESPYSGSYQGESINREAYVMVDSRVFSVELVDSTNERYRRNAVVYDYGFWGYGYYPFFYYYPGVVVVRENTSHILTAKLQLTQDIQRALAQAISYKIRLYAGKNPVTLEATDRQLEALKKFLFHGMPPVTGPAAPASDRGAM